MKNKILKAIKNDETVVDAQIDDIVNGNICYMVYFKNDNKVRDNIMDLKEKIEYNFVASVYLLKEQIEDQINEAEETINIDFYIDIIEISKKDAFFDLLAIEKEIGTNTGYWLNEAGDYYSEIYCEKIMQYAKSYGIEIPDLEDFREFDDDFEYELYDKMGYELAMKLEDRIQKILEVE